MSPKAQINHAQHNFTGLALSNTHNRNGAKGNNWSRNKFSSWLHHSSSWIHGYPSTIVELSKRMFKSKRVREKNAKNFRINLPENELTSMKIVDRRVYERIWKTWRINQKQGLCSVWRWSSSKCNLILDSRRPSGYGYCSKDEDNASNEEISSQKNNGIGW